MKKSTKTLLTIASFSAIVIAAISLLKKQSNKTKNTATQKDDCYYI